ncbi:arylsulfatase A-like enzyme [Marinilabilia salmonicolor]|uniref:Arylsulfatase A-like enzyme n=2 Tax=Marinilabilia salmonicolor TaxID=989 RepID=A0A2T0XBZ4_9BACT|nr:arylsulfatase A-like enzyme [Marinilabilia salmonicolor]RCW37609.1 arylsulfatase A-like enzyme [Marinilabilia salmonicolor]
MGLSLLSGTILSSCAVDSPHKQSPNIVMFLVDDMGWQDTSVPFWKDSTKFNKRYHTPNMERLANQGVKFTQAYACAVCSPTRVSLMTGMNAARHRVTNWTLKQNTNNDKPHPELRLPQWNVNGLQPVDSIENTIQATTLPQILSNHGYYTIHTGKAHFGAMNTPGENPENLGFKVNIAGHAAGAPGSFKGENNYSSKRRNGRSDWDVPGLNKYHGTDTYLTEALTLEALNAIRKPIAKGTPFFLYMAHYAVHTPIEADNRFVQKYLDAGLDETEAAYASMIEGMDKSLGDILTFLDQNDLTENTIILFMSDNGGLSAHTRTKPLHTHNAPLKSGKGSAYEGGIRVPMIVKHPGLTKAATTCETPVIIEDFFPTILEMAGIETPVTSQTIDGESFLPLLTNTSFQESDRPLYWHYPNKWGAEGPGIGTTSSIRKGDWKMIYWYKDQKKELYNLRNDISETNDLSTDFPEKIKELSNDLGNFLRKSKAQRPVFKSTGKTVPWPDEK